MVNGMRRMGSGYYSTITPEHIYVSQNELITWGVSFTVNKDARLQPGVRLVSKVKVHSGETVQTETNI